MSRYVRTGPLPPDVFKRVNDTHALVIFNEGCWRRVIVVYRDPSTGVVYKGGVRLDHKFLKTDQRWIRQRWLESQDRRELRLAPGDDKNRNFDQLPFIRQGRRKIFMLTDEQWEGR